MKIVIWLFYVNLNAVMCFISQVCDNYLPSMDKEMQYQIRVVIVCKIYFKGLI